MKLNLPLALVSLSTLGACATFVTDAPDGPPTPTAADRHEISVHQSSQRLEIAVAAADTALSPKSAQDLQALASGYLRYGHGALILSAPSGGSNSEAAQRVAQHARTALTEAGVDYSAIASTTYDGTGEAAAPLVVSFARYEANAPECAPLWEQDLAHQSDNQPWASFGCATQANLAAMIEDPRDLLHPREEEARDSARRDTIFGAYRQGNPTGATRSNDERISIRNGVGN